MDYLKIITLIIVGWTAGAESGSWACVHPVINQLPHQEQVLFQKGLLKTFGRIMPVLMPLSFILVIVLCVGTPVKTGQIFYLRLVTATLMSSMIVTTVFFNVPVNVATGNWDDGKLASDWKKKRRKWRFFQGYRSVVLVVSFILLTIASI